MEKNLNHCQLLLLVNDELKRFVVCLGEAITFMSSKEIVFPVLEHQEWEEKPDFNVDKPVNTQNTTVKGRGGAVLDMPEKVFERKLTVLAVDLKRYIVSLHLFNEVQTSSQDDKFRAFAICDCYNASTVLKRMSQVSRRKKQH